MSKATGRTLYACSAPACPVVTYVATDAPATDPAPACPGCAVAGVVLIPKSDRGRPASR